MMVTIPLSVIIVLLILVSDVLGWIGSENGPMMRVIY